jgi:hypothetical protein
MARLLKDVARGRGDPMASKTEWARAWEAFASKDLPSADWIMGRSASTFARVY